MTSPAELANQVRAGIGVGDRLVPNTMSMEEADALAALSVLETRLEQQDEWITRVSEHSTDAATAADEYAKALEYYAREANHANGYVRRDRGKRARAALARGVVGETSA